MTNHLYYGDNLEILRLYIGDETVDLIYLDPPFKSDRDYNVLFAEQDGSRAAAQIKAFGDMWQWDAAAARVYEETVEAGGRVSQVLQAFRGFLGANDMLAYLAMMAPRLVELRRTLKPTGSLYLHCDPTASHYLKILLDAVTLGKDDPFQFQWWALGLVGARPVEQKKGADKGIDGRLYFHDDVAGAKTKQIIFSVKAGRLSVPQVRDLRGVIEREGAEIGVLLSLQDPTQPMRAEAASAGFYESPWGTRHPRLQLLTIPDLLSGMRVDRPTQQGNVTFKPAPAHQRATGKQGRLFRP